MPWFIYYALKQLFPTGKWISFFSFISIIGVSLGVCVLLIVQSVMNGFGENIRERLTRTQGEIIVYSDQSIVDWRSIHAQLTTSSCIKGVVPFVENIAMIQSDSSSAFPIARGVDLDAQNTILPVENFIIEGDISELDDYTVFLGIKLAKQLKTPIGSIVSVYSPSSLKQLKEDEIIFPTEYTVAGFITTGSPQFDGQLILGTLAGFQELLDVGDTVNGFNVKLKKGEDLDAAKQLIVEQMDAFSMPLNVLTWIDLNEDFLYVVEQEKAIISFIIIFILLVASFSIAVALTLSVIRRTREIGLLSSLGAQSWQIAACFCFQGLIIGILGSFLGVISAYTFLENRDAIFSMYVALTQADLAFLGVYDLYSIPVKYLRSDFIDVFVISLTVSFLAAIIPAYRAAKLKPSNALRNE